MKIKISNAATRFKLYEKGIVGIESSVFDLISGDKETKQTKGLAYLLKIQPQIISSLLNMPELTNAIKEIGFNTKLLSEKCLIYIDAEMLSEGQNPIRRDITISFYKDNQILLVVIIEAKSIKQKNTGDITQQLHKYFYPSLFPKDSNVPKIGVVLTKYRQLLDDKKIASITWSQVVNILAETYEKHNKSLENKLVKDYIDFVMEVDKEVNYYEKEVLSVPAGKTFDLISKFYIHACPNSYPYKTPLYMTFRKKGGEMDTLYQIEDIVIINPSEDSYKTIIEKSTIKEKDRIQNYILQRKAEWRFKAKDEDYRFYILSKKREIKLPHKPKIINSGHCYFSLAELLCGEKDVVVESRE